MAGLLAGLLLLAPAVAGPRNIDLSLAGLRLVDALERLREAGLPLVWSSEIVPETLRVRMEPAGNTLRERLDSLLEPFGLVAEKAPGGLLLVRRRPVSVTGIVLSDGDGRPIPGARVESLSGPGRALCEKDGRFLLEGLRSRPVRLLVAAPGFLPRELEVFPRPEDRVVELTILIAPVPLLAREITVHPPEPSSAGGEAGPTRQVGPDRLESTPALGRDVLRVLPQLPGITAPDNSSRLILRGAEPRDVTYLLDGIELFEPYHLQGLQAPFSLIDSSLARRVRVLTGPLSADHGDRFGGVVDIATRLPDVPFRARASAGTLESSASAEGVLPGGRVSFLASARRWYPGEWIDTIDAGVEGLDPTLDDGFAKLAWTAAPGLIVFAQGLVGHDVVHFSSTEDADRIDARSRSRYLWGGLVAAIGPRTTVRTIAYQARWSAMRNGSGEVDLAGDVVGVDDVRRTTGWGVRQDWSWIAPARVTIGGGWEFRVLRTRFDYSRTTVAGDGATLDRTGASLAPEDHTIAAWADGSVSLGPRLVLSGGLRWQRHDDPEEAWLDPRASLRWEPSARTLLSVGAGIVHQSERPYELQVEDGIRALHPAQRARRLSVSFEQAAGPRARIRLEAWQDRLTRLRPRFENAFNPIDLFPEGQPDRVLLAPDVAQLQGIELSVGQSAGSGQPWSWWAAVTRSRAVDRVEGRFIPRPWDQPWAFAGQLTWRKGDLRFGAAATARTGWPRTPLVPGTAAGSGIVHAGPLRSARLAPYVRFDVSAERAFRLGDSRLMARVTLLDLLNRHNECCWSGPGPEPRPGGGFAVPEIDHWRGRSLLLEVAWSFPPAAGERSSRPRHPPDQMIR